MRNERRVSKQSHYAELCEMPILFSLWTFKNSSFTWFNQSLSLVFPPCEHLISVSSVCSSWPVITMFAGQRTLQDCTKVCLPHSCIHQKYPERLNAGHFARHWGCSGEKVSVLLLRSLESSGEANIISYLVTQINVYL